MAFLVFQLQASMAAWGDSAVGEHRPSQDAPGVSALAGMLGAALGIRREEEAIHMALNQGYGFAIGVQHTGTLLRDYHTAQVPGQSALKKRPHATRRDELSIPKDQLNTILSTRDYRQDAAYLIAIQAFTQAPFTLAEIAAALQKPRFCLYLGRKACPPSAPLNPELIEALTVREAFDSYLASINRRRTEHIDDKFGSVPLESPAAPTRIVWSEGMDAGVPADLKATNKDRLIRRQSWQFGDRIEYVALLAKE